MAYVMHVAYGDGIVVSSNDAYVAPKGFYYGTTMTTRLSAGGMLMYYAVYFNPAAGGMINSYTGGNHNVWIAADEYQRKVYYGPIVRLS